MEKVLGLLFFIIFTEIKRSLLSPDAALFCSGRPGSSVLPDPERCDGAYSCVFNNPDNNTHIICPPGSMFDNNTERCIPDDMSCLYKERLSKEVKNYSKNLTCEPDDRPQRVLSRKFTLREGKLRHNVYQKMTVRTKHDCMKACLESAFFQGKREVCEAFHFCQRNSSVPGNCEMAIHPRVLDITTVDPDASCTIGHVLEPTNE